MIGKSIAQIIREGRNENQAPKCANCGLPTSGVRMVQTRRIHGFVKSTLETRNDAGLCECQPDKVQPAFNAAPKKLDDAEDQE